MSTPNRDSALAAAEAHLTALREQVQALGAQVTAAAAAVQALRDTQTADRLTGRTPAEMWTDPDLRAFVIDRDWSNGHGDLPASEFLARAISDLAPGDFYEYERQISDDGRTVVRVLPRLMLTHGQDIQPARRALLRMWPALTVNGALHAAVFEHTLCEGGRQVMLVVRDEHDATVLVGPAEEFTGSLADALTRLARDHWYDGGPPDDLRW
jgi:hypothetical protein